jgi:hypothetical protein
MTNALCVGSEPEVDAWNHVVDLAMAHMVPLVPIILTAEVEENVRRLADLERVGRKLTDGAALRANLASDRIQAPSVRETAMIDVTRKSPRGGGGRCHSACPQSRRRSLVFTRYRGPPAP